MNNRHRTLIWIFSIALLAPAFAAETSAAPSSSRASIYEITHLFSNVSFSVTKIFFKEEGGFRDTAVRSSAIQSIPSALVCGSDLRHCTTGIASY